MLQFPQIYPVTCHTDHVGKGSTFVAIKGKNARGLDYCMQALDRGATTLVCEYNEIIPADLQERIDKQAITVIRVDNARQALAHLSAQAAGYPARQLKIIGVTGTKGKTTTTFLLEHILKTAGYRTALLGTVHNSILNTYFVTGLTTQQPDYLHQFFTLCVQETIDYVIMEVAAQGLSLHRVDGIEFDGVIFTNFSQEHAEFYSSLEEYFKAKCQIFDQLKDGAPLLLNSDDAWCQKLTKVPPAVYYGLHNDKAFIQAYEHVQPGNGLTFDLRINDQRTFITCPSLIGTFNTYNLVAAAGLAYHLGIPLTTIATAAQSFTRVPGRMERHPLANGACCIIDYAHNPSSYESVLSTLRPLTKHLIVVFGCGGDRDATKRPIMGSIAAKYADLIVLTSDNPRSECPVAIMNAIKAGIGSHYQDKVVWYQDRQQAIEYAYSRSRTGSLIALLGKGPDEYQIVGSIKTYFSETAIIKGLGNMHL